ncbi:MAG: response regulator, partial [Gemmatimonadota bacterium]
GLGLSTVAAIVRGHGGFVNVQSEPGSGSTFEVYLPAAPARAAGKQKEPEIGGGASHRGSDELVLVVDDDDAVRDVTRRTLEASGYRVLTASEGTEAMALFAKNQGEISLVITDMMMPVMDGDATIRAIRRIDEEVPILAVSGLGAKIGREGDGVDFLAKPYTGDALRAAVQRLVAPGSGESSAG